MKFLAAFEEEGIFRISGHGGIQDELKWAFDKGMNIDLNKYKGLYLFFQEIS